MNNTKHELWVVQKSTWEGWQTLTTETTQQDAQRDKERLVRAGTSPSILRVVSTASDLYLYSR